MTSEVPISEVRLAVLVEELKYAIHSGICFYEIYFR